MMLDCLSTRVIADLLGIVVRQVNRRAEREGWESRPRAGRGGGRDWIIASMPKATRHEIGCATLRKPFRREINLFPAHEPLPSLPAESTSPAPSTFMPNVTPFADTGKLTAKQRNVMIARKAILNEVARLARSGVMSKRDAIRALDKAWHDETLEEGLRQAAINANDKTGTGKTRGLSYPTIYRWLKAFGKGGEFALTPKHPGPDMHVPEWAKAFLAIWQVPSKPSVADAYRQFADICTGKLPSIFAVRRWLDKMAVPDREAGRATGNALLKLRPYKQRKTDELWAGDIYTADGTTFDAEIQHPIHGQPFKPEATAVIDVVSRRCLGFSVGESESGYVVLDALRMACLFGGIPSMFYVDNGSGYKNTMMTDEARGIMARLDIEMRNSIPGRPRGKGLMERAVQTICVAAAKRLPSCTHDDMDCDAGKKVYKIIRADLKGHGKSKFLPTFEDFKRVILKRVEEYNATPHRSLPKIVDPTTGKRRHMSPDECWNSFQVRGFMPLPVPQAIRDELFMPGVPRKVANGMVRLFNGVYFADELANFHDDYVEVRYDIWDSSKVYCWTTRGEKICTAELDGNAIDYFPKAQVQAARERRDAGRVARLVAKIDRVAPGATVQLPETPPTYTMMADSITRPSPEPIVLGPPNEEMESEPHDRQKRSTNGKARRPTFMAERERYIWLINNHDRWRENDHEWIQQYVSGDEYKDLLPYYAARGLAWSEASACC